MVELLTACQRKKIAAIFIRVHSCCIYPITMLRMCACAMTAVSVLGASGFVELLNDGGTWWFVQNGVRFQSYAANHVNNGGPDDGVGGREAAVCQAATNNSLCGDSLNFGGQLGYAPYFNVTQDKYGPDVATWANASLDFLRSTGFNGISGWSARAAEVAAAARGMTYFHLLDIGTTWPHSGQGLDWDAWSDEFSAQCAAIAAAEVAPRANDTALIAWQTDNENNFRATGLVKYLGAYGTGPGGAAAVSALQARYGGSLDALNSAWGTHATAWSPAALSAALPAPNAKAFAEDDGAWQAAVVDRYLGVAVAAIRKYDTNHLISGVRFSYNTPQIAAAAAKHVDFIDQHDYGDLPNISWIHELTGLPVILGEMSFTAADSNLPNTHGARAGRPEVTQTRRAAKYFAYMQALLPQPYVLGVGWWNFVDEPATGRWPDGENSNYGLRTLADDTYEILVAAMKEVHALAPGWHAAGTASPLLKGGVAGEL